MTEYLSKINVLTQDQYDNAQKNENEIYLITDAATGEVATTNTTAMNRPVSVANVYGLDIANYSNFVIRAEGGDISVTPINVPNSGGLYYKVTIVIEYKTATVINFPTSFVWKDGTAPTFSVNNIYVISISSHTKGGIWFASVDGVFSNSNIDDIPLNDSENVLLYDYFNRTNSTTGIGTSTSGHNWQVVSGEWGIIDNTIYAVNGTTAGAKLAVIDTGRTDNIRISADYYHTTTTPSDSGLVFGLVSATNYLQLTYSGGKLAMRHPTNGEIGTASTVSLNSNTWYKLRIDIVGTSIKAYLDDVLMISGTYNITSNASKHGFKHYSGAGVRFDNFVIEEIK